MAPEGLNNRSFLYCTAPDPTCRNPLRSCYDGAAPYPSCFHTFVLRLFVKLMLNSTYAVDLIGQ